ncbi:hypothetical protein KL939_001160 [Ogataea angusta]|nr:hypothetical protein KL939_001160 [Ogataea angusta]
MQCRNQPGAKAPKIAPKIVHQEQQNESVAVYEQEYWYARRLNEHTDATTFRECASAMQQTLSASHGRHPSTFKSPQSCKSAQQPITLS